MLTHTTARDIEFDAVKPCNSIQLKQLDFFCYCGVFHYFEGSEALNRTFLGQTLFSFAGFSAILKSAIAGFYYST